MRPSSHFERRKNQRIPTPTGLWVSCKLRARTVEARYFLLKDEDGRVRARLSVYPKQVVIHGKVSDMPPGKVIPGQAALQFFDENGEEVWAEPKQPTFEETR
jgi:hypothetical protein